MSVEKIPEQTKKRSTLFKPGQSGNPAGRKKGIVDKRVKYREMLATHAPEIVEKCVDLARSGDVNAIKLCFQKLIPNANGNYLTNAQIKKLAKGDINEVLNSNKDIINAVFDKQVTVEQGQSMTSVLTAHAALIEKSDIFKRMEERLLNIESKLN